MNTVSITLNEERNVTLTAYLQTIASDNAYIEKRPAMIVLPGGGYNYCSDREADPVAFEYLSVGYQVFILRYSVAENKAWDNPLKDYEQAYELIVSKSDEWHIDIERIAVIGFSAGGHLAAACATIAEHRPSACILGYPVITKQTTSVYNPEAPGIDELVDDSTCPCFIFSSRTDNVVPIDNTLKLATALTKHNIPYELHIYAYANHGFSTCESCIQQRSWICSRTPSWVKDSIEWLKDTIGDFNGGVMGKRSTW